MAFGYRYTLERQENGWWLVRFPAIPEALTEGETESEARANARDCVIAALEGYMTSGRPLPREGAGHSGLDRVVLPSLVTAKLVVYETMRARGWSKLKLAKELGMPENSVRRLLDLHHSSHMWIIDAALAKMNAELPIDLPKVRRGERPREATSPCRAADRAQVAAAHAWTQTKTVGLNKCTVTVTRRGIRPSPARQRHAVGGTGCKRSCEPHREAHLADSFNASRWESELRQPPG
jgi:antitoxin HicB